MSACIPRRSVSASSAGLGQG
jgi:hypothetical protein